jgi:hypothetical protein
LSEKIYVFKSVDDAVSTLKKYRHKNSNPERSIDEIVHSTQGNTFRAFRNVGYPPSKIFRHWAYRYFNKIANDMDGAKTQKEFDKRLIYWVSALQKQWQSKSKKNIDFGRAAKLVNLFVRDIWESIDPVTGKFYVKNRKVQKFLHVPFDSFSLRPLRKIIQDLTSEKIENIPSNASMKYVESRKQYMILQEAVRQLCKKAKTDPIIYEYWSWNRTH